MKRIFQRSDWIAALVPAAIAFAVYAYTAAPNVTLLDSGEFIVAAQHFGVPHPTGYPLWTLMAWLFQLLPLGNAAWEIALFSGVTASFAVGLCGLLSHHMLGWFGVLRGLPNARMVRFSLSVSFSLLLAFSVSMWSQAVIAEVYGLHAAMIGLFFTLLYMWVHRPGRDRLMLGAFFVLALSFSNHHLTLALAPLPYLLILLLRRRAFIDWLFAGALAVLLVFLGFAILSNDLLVLRTAIRLFYCILLGGAILLGVRRLRIRWKLMAFLPVAIVFGLLPYAYMPIASGTNPPMNWSYARDPEGFFYSFNRSQYSGPLSEVSLKTFGRLTGSLPPNAKMGVLRKQTSANSIPLLTRVQMWTGFFWEQLSRSFTPLCLLFYFISIIAAIRLPLPQRTWIYTLHIAFALAAFLQPLWQGAEVDAAGWWLQMPYHTYTNWVFAVLCSLGAGLLTGVIAKRFRPVMMVGPAMIFLPLLMLRGNYDICSQRDRWLGWDFGRDILKDLPKGSVMIGGTDAGRFVPTYMIFGESGQDPKQKRDPAFDRRDLYIITQNALGEKNYMKYLRDHYTTARPAPRNAFERWLGRANTYPSEFLVLPSQEEVEDLIDKVMKGKNIEDLSNHSLMFAEVLRWIWEKNKDRHNFYMEESFPLEWTYDYATPYGLIYKIEKEPTGTLSPEVVDRDFAYWKNYKERLLANPQYARDFDARRAFSKLRGTIGNIYHHKKMDAEARRAYLEAVELWAANPEAILNLVTYYARDESHEDGIALIDGALAEDPNSLTLWRFRFFLERRMEISGEVKELTTQLVSQPRSRDILSRLLQLHTEAGDTNRSDELATNLLQNFAEDPEMLRSTVFAYFEQFDQTGNLVKTARRLVEIEPSNPNNRFLLASAHEADGHLPEFYQSLAEGIKMSGLKARETLLADRRFARFQNDPEFRRIIEGGSPSVTPSPTPSQSPKPPTGGHEQKTLRSP